MAIGTDKTITYQFLTSSETISNYFKIIDESNSQILSLIDKYSISSTQYFPIFGFSKINTSLASAVRLMANQEAKLEHGMNTISPACKQTHTTIVEILEETSIPASSKETAIFWSIMSGNLNVDEVESYLRNYSNKKLSSYKKMLCAFDFIKYR